MNRLMTIFGFLFVFVGIGWWTSWSSKEFPDQFVDRSYSGSRDPAAIRKSYDFSELDGLALSQATKQRLMAGAQFLKQQNEVGVELGHFVVRGDNGGKTFACNKYENVILEFEGDGMAVSGQKPSMQVQGECEISADINRISPIWIPVAKILGEPVGEGDFDFHDKKSIHVKFANVQDQWPRTWVLKNVILKSSHGDTLTIDNQELRQMVPKPLVLEF